MMPWPRACSVSAILLCALAQAGDGDGPDLRIRAADAAPVVDGRFDADEWKDGATFEVRRGDDIFGEGRLVRHARQLYLRYRSFTNARALGIRFAFTDLVSRQQNLLIVQPLQPPDSPLAAFRQAQGRYAERVDAARCDVRFSFPKERHFDLEMRAPLDLLEIGRRDQKYLFAVEVWDREAERVLAVYPVSTGLAGPKRARLAPEGDWGADVPVDAPEPARQPALALLAEFGAERRDRTRDTKVFRAFTGWDDGRRKDAPLTSALTRLTGLVEQFPDYASLRAELVTAAAARGEFETAIRVLESVAKDFPELTLGSVHHLVHVQMLRSAGRYDDALEHLAANRSAAGEDAVVARERTGLQYLAAAGRAEKQNQAAAPDDLPRVALETSKGRIVLELFEDDAPNAVANFVSLVERGFYNGTRFHWVEGGRRAVGGDPNSKDEDPDNDGFGNPGYYIEPEPGRRCHLPYTVSFMDERRTSRTEGCVFSIQMAPSPGLDGRNTVFGRVVEGRDVVARLEYYDRIEDATVLSKRPHPYEPAKRKIQ